MILTDYEWLRFVTLGIVAGGVLGALYETALLAAGRPPLHAVAGAIIGVGVLAIGLHLLLRWLLGRATTPQGDSGQETTEESTA